MYIFVGLCARTDVELSSNSFSFFVELVNVVVTK